LANSVRHLVWVGAALYVAAACGGKSVSIEEAPDPGSGGDGASGGSSSGGVGTGGRNVTGGAGGAGGAVGGAGGVGAVGGVNVTGGVGATGGFGGKGFAGKGGLGGSAGFGGKGFAGKGGVGGSAGFGGSAGTEIGGFGGAIDDPCTPNPCLNDGVCVSDDESYACDCAPGYAGIVCQVYVGHCTDNPCQNGGVCTDVPDGFTCACPPPYQGPTCEDLPSDCDAEPCKNGGSCSDLPGGGFACSCPVGLEQPTCETGSITVSATARGWWDSSGRHDAINDNTLTGFCACGTEQTNSYFTFLLPNFSGNVASVGLRLEIESYASTDAAEAYAVYDVSTNAMTLEASASGSPGVPVYNDLMTGALYSTFLVSSQSVGTIMSLDLLDIAAEDVDGKRGSYFSVGVHLATFANRPNTPEYVRFSGLDEPRVHELVLNLE
jgi:hypothetical protein